MSDEDLTDIISDDPIEEAVADDAPEKVAEPEPAPAAPEPKVEAPMVPLAAMTEERVKRQMLEQRLAEIEKSQQAKPAPPPDVLDDQNGFVSYIESQLQQRIQSVELNVNERLTRQQHGSDVVDAAMQAAQEAGVVDQFRGKPDAWGDLVRWHQTQEAAREIGDPTTYKERVRAEILKEVQAEMAAKQISAAPSLADETNMGNRQPPSAPTLTPLDDIL